MAVRRSFSPDVVETDAFLEMPDSAQSLYFHLGMRCDDDGFITPKSTMRMVGSNEDDLKVLIAKGFVVPFESGVIVIRHWLMNNRLRKDWYRPTQYVAERALLTGGPGKPYIPKIEEKPLFSLGTEPVPIRQHSGVVVSKLVSKEENSFKESGENSVDKERQTRQISHIRDHIKGTQKRLFPGV